MNVLSLAQFPAVAAAVAAAAVAAAAAAAARPQNWPTWIKNMSLLTG